MTGGFFVDTAGNDANPGTLEKPFATLACARDAIRKKGPRTVPLTVWIRNGTYFLPEPLVFLPEDSGTLSAPVVYAAFPGEKPVLSAGCRLTGWKQTEINGCKAWETAAPKWDFHQLWVNGSRRSRPRLPKEGLYHVKGVPPDPVGGFYEGHKTFYAEPGQVKTWRNLEDTEIVAFSAWVDSRMPIVAVDEATGQVTSSLRSALGFASGPNASRYYVDNVAEALDQPGLWYHDRSAHKVFYLPLPGETPESVDVIVPKQGAVVRLAGDPEAGRFVEHLSFRELQFSHAEWWRSPDTALSRWEIHEHADMRVRRVVMRKVKGDAAGDHQCAVSVPGAVTAIGARHCRFDRCHVTQSGTYGLELGRGCSANEVLACEFSDLGGGGVKFGTEQVADAPSSGFNRLRDCHIHNVGVIFHSAVGIWVGESGNNVIAHNLVHDLYYTGISIGWTWGYQATGTQNNLVEFNHVHHVGKGWLYDMGGIYTLGQSPGTLIRNNLIHDIVSDDLGAVGLYHDEGSSHIVSENNLVYRIWGDVFHQNYGEENVLRNNIFALGRRSQLARGREDGGQYFTFEHNIIYFTEGELLGFRWNDNRFRMRENLYWWTTGQEPKFADGSWMAWRQRGHDGGSRISDPLFVDPAQGDFSLRPESPAFTLGFKKIDLSTVGPRPPGKREEFDF